jgi:hypothetical protein
MAPVKLDAPLLIGDSDGAPVVPKHAAAFIEVIRQRTARATTTTP